MYFESDTRIGVTVCVCSKCGNRLYEGYPRRNGAEEQREWEKNNIPTPWDRENRLLSISR